MYDVDNSIIDLINQYISNFEEKIKNNNTKKKKYVTENDLLINYDLNKNSRPEILYKICCADESFIDYLKENEDEIFDDIQKNIEKKINKHISSFTMFSQDGFLTLDPEKEDKVLSYHNSLFVENLFKKYIEFLNKKNDLYNKPFETIEKDYLNAIKILRKILNILNDSYQNIELPKITDLLDKINKDTIILSDPIKTIFIRDINEYINEKKNVYYENKKIEEEKNRIRIEELNKLRDEEKRLKELKEVKPERKKELKDLVKNFDKIENLFLEYSMIIPDGLETMNLEEIFNEEDIKEISNLSFQEIDPELFLMVVITMLSKLNNTDDTDIINNYVSYFDNICNKYQINSQIDELDKTIQSIFVNFICSDEDSKKLAFYQGEVFRIKNYGIYSEDLEKEVEKIKNEIYTIRSNNFIKIFNGIKIPIKSFILFDYENVNGEMNPYITSDLDEKSSKTMVDSSVDKSKIISNGYNDFNELVSDLLLFGNPKVLLNQTDKMNKYVRPVYFINNSYDYINTSMENSTGMYRIRPNLISNVRFIDEKVKLIPNTEKFNQIKELLESKLPNISISDHDTFDIYINYLTSFKTKDLDSYKTSRNRQENSQIRAILKNKNNSFSPDELSLISQMIDSSLQAYKELKNINENFDFKIIDKFMNNQTLN